MKLYLCIDDTDDFESKGTGEIAEEIALIIEEKNLGKTSAVTRHQLYIHEDIPYTSHNSSMCFEIDDIKKESFEAIINIAADYLIKVSSKLADPGLCICDIENVDINEIIEYGLKAKTEVLKKAYAYEVAKTHNIFLNEYGGTGHGIIGALAGIGLRLSGNDGRFKGKIRIDEGEYFADTLIKDYNIEKIYDITSKSYLEKGVICLSGKTKTILQDYMRVLPVYKIDNKFMNCTKEQLRKY